MRALLIEDLGGEFFNPGNGDDGWRVSLATVLKEQLTDSRVRILVVDGDEGLAACGIATIEQRLPGLHLRDGRLGNVIGMGDR
ncbi:hypothetical protein OG943_26135 [Amycolatopsis sp. NBC_00345]|uniref:hypothetical protein n=1 Tax=Amycolatopsis sp. NBC_00345 TaxID=2975955 RepID=UPI002E25AE7A